MSSAYPDPDGMLAGYICRLCQVMLNSCTCRLPPHPPRASPITASTLLSHPEWPLEWPRDVHLFESQPPATARPEQHAPTGNYAYGQSLQPLHPTLQHFDEDAITVTPDAVYGNILDTYTPGDRTASRPASSQSGPWPHPQRRQPPRTDGFRCEEKDCGRTFNRSCDLRRHQIKHLDPSQRPHKCKHCNNGFYYPKDLTRHERTHGNLLSSQRHYYCHEPGCSNTDGFSRHDNFLRHLRNQHPNLAV